MKIDWDKQEARAKKLLDRPDIREDNKFVVVHVAKKMLSLFIPICSAECTGLNRNEAMAALDMMKLAVDIEYADRDGKLKNAPGAYHDIKNETLN